MKFSISALRQKLRKSSLAVFFWALKRYVKCTPAIRQQMAEELKAYGLPQSGLNRALIRMYFDCTRHEVTVSEYFSYHFIELSEVGKHSFVGLGEKFRVLEDMYTDAPTELLDNKYETYCLLRPYYGRDLIFVNSDTPETEVLEFARRHSKFIAKPHNLSKGRGIRIYDVSDSSDEALRALYSEILENCGTAVLEEMIQQAPEMAAFHPSSVNTIRIATYRDASDNVIPLFSIIRMGLGGSVVDNSSNGGIMSSVDIASGVVKTAAVSRKQRETFLFHPDTGEQIIGFQVPDWKGLVERVSQAARLVTFPRYVGWDLALTESGWVIVEANGRPAYGFQIAERKGGRNLLHTILDT